MGTERSLSADRAAEVLAVIGRLGQLRIADLASELGVQRRNVSRIAASLEHAGLLRRGSPSHAYDLGPTLAWLGEEAESRLHINAAARTYLRALMTATKTTSVLFSAQSDGLISVAVEIPHDRLAVSFPLATGIPHTQGVGKLLQVYGIASVVPATQPGHIPSSEQTLIRERGFLISDGEVVPGVKAIGSPIITRDGAMTGVVAVASTVPVEHHAPALMETTRAIADFISS